MKILISFILLFASSVFAQDRVLRDVQTIIWKEPSGGGSDRMTLTLPAIGSSFTLTLPTSAGSNGQVLSTNGSGVLSWADTATLPVNLTSDVTGALPIANGGSNKALTLSNGGILWTDADSFEVLSAGTSGQLLTSGGAGAPTWTTVLPIANGGTNNGSLGVTSGGIYYGDGSKLAQGSAGTSGQVLTSSGSGAYTWKTFSSGNYTPTLTNGTNVASSTSPVCFYTRNENIVVVSCSISITCIAAGPTQTVIHATLPVASNFTASADLNGHSSCSGSGGCIATGNEVGTWQADATNDRASLDFPCNSTTSNTVRRSTFVYRIL